MIRKIGTKTLEWITAKKILDRIYKKKGIYYCELRFKGCFPSWTLAYAHRYRRTDPRSEHTFEGTIRACSNCHQKLDADKDLTEEMFRKLRSA